MSVDFGQELKVANGISWLEDIQSFYRERVLIEKEYATKLNALSKRYYDKKSKKSAMLSVGESPTLTPGSLESASLTTWTTILTKAEDISKEHDNLANQLTNKVCDVLKSLESRYDEFRKKHETIASKLTSERDNVYSDLKKCKTRYDLACQEVEQKRQKIDKSHDLSKLKAEKAYRAELMEMNNVKNMYLIQLNVANRYKEKYFHEELPKIINSLQDLNETRVAKLNYLWTIGGIYEKSCHENCIDQLESQISEVERNILPLDSAMFAKHNLGGWQEPGDFLFEPSPMWHDTPNIVTDESASIVLRNTLHKSRRGLESAKEDCLSRDQFIGTLKRKRDATKLDESKADDELTATRSLLFYEEERIPFAAKLLCLQVETATITALVGDQDHEAQAHNFKTITFKIPTNCDLCNERAWGITTKGVLCKDCGYTAHAKCEIKTPATCPGVLDKAAKKALKDEKRQSVQTALHNLSQTDLSKGVTPALSRSNTLDSLSSSYGSVGGGSAAPVRLENIPGNFPDSQSPESTVSSILADVSATTQAPLRSGASLSSRRVLAPPPGHFVKSPSLPQIITRTLPSGEMKYTFTPEEQDIHEQLALEAGTKVTILDDDDSGWLQVRSGGQEGQVPKDYVSISSILPPKPHSSLPVLTPRPTSVSVALVGKKAPAPPPPRGHKKGTSQQGNVEMVRALYDYNPRQSGREPAEDEIGFAAHDEFLLLRKGDPPQWNRVRTPSGEEGIVPESYMEEVKNNS